MGSGGRREKRHGSCAVAPRTERVASRQCKQCSVWHEVMICDRGTMGVNGDAMTRALLTAGAGREIVHRCNLFPVLAQKLCSLRLVQALEHRLVGF